MVMHLYSVFSMCIYSNALYNTLWGTLPDCFMAQFTIFFVQQVEFTGAPRTEQVMPDHNTGNLRNEVNLTVGRFWRERP